MCEYQRDQFVEAFNLDEPAETACIRRFITGDDECPHNPLEADDGQTGLHSQISNQRPRNAMA